jgi:oleandomycin transport system permease protein
MADMARYACLCVVMIGFGYVLGFRATTSVPEVLLACVLAVAFALCLCWASVFVGMRARTPGAVQGLMVLIVLPLSFGSSAFVSPDSMPGWLKTFTDVNPLTHLVGAERALLLGQPMGQHLIWTFVWMGILLAVFVPLALWAYRKRV